MNGINDLRGLWRGKLKYNVKPYKKGEWVEGHFTRLDDNNAAIIPHIYGYGEVEVEEDTLGECTSSRDENGKPIFEGDICAVDDKIGVVRYDEEAAAFILDCDVQHLTFFYDINSSDVEVVGNIYDNPELLKGGN